MEPVLETLVDGFQQQVIQLLQNCQNRGITMHPYFTLRDPFTQAKLGDNPEPVLKSNKKSIN